MAKPEEYICIEVWHKQTGSFRYYIENLQHTASITNAPVDAIYRREDGTWARASELRPDHEFFDWMKKAGKEVPKP